MGKKASHSTILIDSPVAESSKAPKFTGLDVSFLKNADENILQHKKDVEKLNPSHKNIWQRKQWNIDFFKAKNLPVIVGTLQKPQLFSSKYKNHGLRFLDLPIHMPDQGWQIPKELEQFKEVIKMAVDHERLCLPDFEKNHYVYLTVDQGVVKPQTSQRRAAGIVTRIEKLTQRRSIPLFWLITCM